MLPAAAAAALTVWGAAHGRPLTAVVSAIAAVALAGFALRDVAAGHRSDRTAQPAETPSGDRPQPSSRIGRIGAFAAVQWRRPYGMIWPFGVLITLIFVLTDASTGDWADIRWHLLVGLGIILLGIYRQGPRP